MKQYWLREEISIADELLALAPALTKEFLAYHTDFVDGDFVNGRPYVNSTFDTNEIQSKDAAWKMDLLRYTYKEKNVKINSYTDPGIKERFPTATALTEKYADDCPISTYSILEKQSIITRHTGIENRDNEFLRIHVPLIVPEGDIFFECEGIEIDWSDIWGFNNQLVHSAHNHTDFRRLVFLIDIRRTAIGLPPEPKFDPNREKFFMSRGFVRGTKPKVYHTCQLGK